MWPGVKLDGTVVSCSKTSEKKGKELCGQEESGRFRKRHLEAWTSEVGRTFQVGRSAHQCVICYGVSTAKTQISAQ